MDNNRPKVGIGLLLLKGNKILLAKRIASHGVGEYSLTGGHMENGESFSECALREFTEEAGSDMKITKPEFLCLNNLKAYLPKHYVDIGLVSHWISGQAMNPEPEKKEDWKWYDLDNLPSPLFGSIGRYLEAYRTGRQFFDD
jgi:8-oxo-dGTP diphosphatase